MIRKTGHYETTVVGGEEVAAFVPAPLPPESPPVRIEGELRKLLDSAHGSLGRLELVGRMVPSVDWFIYAYLRKEAVLSSQIEGTRATLIDLLSLEADRPPEAGSDVADVSNYLVALRHAREQLQRPDGLPISMRLLNEAHRRLLQGQGGAHLTPGAIRRSQNWIGGTRPGNAAFVPPPPHALGDLLSRFERYIHADDPLPPLIRIGLCHAQFETIHPYLDGNGRIGRLLITLLLEQYELLTRPLLYLSLFLKEHRAEYYRRLGGIRRHGDWEGWLAYFLEGVHVIAEEAVSMAGGLHEIVREDRTTVLALPAATLAAIRLFELLPRNPVLTVSRTMALLGLSRPPAQKAVDLLEDARILKETSGRRRDRVYHYHRYLERLGAGLEPPDLTT